MDIFLRPIFVVAAVLLLACSTAPTGRRQLTLVDSDRMSAMGDQSFEEIKKQQAISTNPRYQKNAQCVANHLLASMQLNPSEWEVQVFEDSSLNAFALPGKNIGVHSGMMKFVDNQHQLAAIMGHEIAHVLSEHGNERVSQNLLAQGSLALADLFIGGDSQKDQLLLAALGVGAQVGVLLPFSRKHENEADELGIQYMAKAGFDPFQAAALWRKMEHASRGAPPEFLSTHPSHQTRIEKLSGLADQYMSAYREHPSKPDCFRPDSRSLAE